jgi:TP901 family phage tail tape measure protein
MGGAAQLLIVSVLINAIDRASPVLRMLGLNSIGSMGMLTAAAATTAAAIGAVGIVSIKMAATFDMNMQKIAALTATSSSQMQDYKDKILAMAPQLDQSPTALAQGLYFIISAGYQGADALNVLKLSAQAAAASMTPMKDVSDLLTTAMNAYRGANLSAGHAMDDIINIVTQGKVTMSSLATSFGFVAVTAQNAGLSFDETSAAVSTLSQVAGEHGSRRVMMDLDNALRQLGPRMELISQKAEKMKGLSAPWDAAAFASMNFMQKLQYIASETGGVGYLDKTQAATYEATGNMQNLAQATAHANKNFMDLVGGAAAFLPTAMLLSDKGKEYNTILASMGGNGNKTAEAFAKMRESTGQKWNMFKVTLETIATAIGLHLLPVVNQLLGSLINAGHGIIAFVQSKQGMETLKSALLGVAVVIGVILAPAIAGAVLAALPFLAIIAGFIIAGRVLGPLIQQVVAHFGGMHGIMLKLHPLLQKIGDALRAAGDELKKAFNDPAVKGALKQLQQDLPKLLPVLKTLAIVVGVILVVGLNVMVGVLHAVLAVLPGVIRLVRGLIEWFSGLFRLVKDIFTGNFKDIPAAVKQILHGLLNIFTGIWESIINGVGGFIDHFLHVFGSSGGKVKKGIHDWLAGADKAIHEFFDGVKTWIHNRLSDLGHDIQGFAEGLRDKVEGGLNDLKNAFEAPFKWIGGLFKWLYDHNTYVKEAVDQAKKDVERLRDGIMNVVGGVKRWLQQTWTTIKHDVSDAWSWVHDHIIQPVQDAIGKVQDAVNGVKTWLLGKWNDIKTDIGNVWSNIMSGAGDILTQITTWVNTNVITPITNLISTMITDAEQWGANLFKSFIKGMTSMAGKVKDAAGNVLSGVAHWAGFHSPSKGFPDSDTWGPNFVKMFASGMLSQASAVNAAASQLLMGAAAVFAGAGAPGGLGGAAGGITGGAAGGVILSGAGLGATNVSHNWAGAFPNATNAAEITKALRSVQQDDYRRGRRAGGYQGLRAGIGLR